MFDSTDGFDESDQKQETLQYLGIKISKKGENSIISFGREDYMVPSFDSIKNIGKTKDGILYFLLIRNGEEQYYILNNFSFPTNIPRGVLDSLTKLNMSTDVLAAVHKSESNATIILGQVAA